MKTPEETQTVDQLLESLTKENIFWYEDNDSCNIGNNIDAVDLIKQALKTAEARGHTEGVRECIKLSDDVEFREPDGGTRQWIAFKAFRNTMRDRLTPTDVTDKE